MVRKTEMAREMEMERGKTEIAEGMEIKNIKNVKRMKDGWIFPASMSNAV